MRSRLFLFLLLSTIHTAASVFAQGTPTFVINLRDTALQAFSEKVAEITGRTIILDPAARGQVTVISAEPLDADGVWSLYQTALRGAGLAAVRLGNVWRVVPQAGFGGAARGPAGGGSQDFVTAMIPLQNLSSAEAQRVLRPLVANFGTLEALQQPNAIVIIDTSENVRRISDLLRDLDTRPARDIRSVRLKFAGAEDAAQILQQLLQSSDASGRPRGAQIAVDQRTNTLLISGDPGEVIDALQVAESLDTPSGTKPTMRVFRLRNGDAETVAEILRGLVGGSAVASNPVAQALATSNGQNVDGVPDPITAPGAVSIQVSKELNAVIARGAPVAVSEAEALIAQLDIRRPQVMIEAAIVEISGDTAEQLGIQFGAGAAAPEGRFAGTSFSLTGLSLRGILTALGVPAAIGLAQEGFSAGFSVTDNFSILIQALAQSSRANLLSTPSITTLDNQSAEIVVAQNVPFLTGSFSPSGNSGDVFSTVEREDVGIILRVVPRVHDGDTVRLEVSQEVSSLVAANTPGAVDLITNRRSIQTTVLADDGGTIVLGGLITDNQISSDSKVPVLGDIPVLGNLFGADQASRTKRTLFVFLRPTILRDRFSVAANTRSRYNRVRNAQTEPLATGSPLFNGAQHTLPLEIEGIY